jgi:prepilin-type N-terminal cleavage/methylation domain-containing protein
MSLRSYLPRSLRPKTLLYWLNRTAQIRQRHRVQHEGDRGFTLTEVLVATIIGALIVSGLLGVMVELLTSDAREAARNETQREMQLAIDYISTDLREAVYVYDGDCMAAVASESSDPELITKNCAGLFPSNVRVPEQSTPVLAFWKLDDLPEEVKKDCTELTADALLEEDAPPCVSGRAYTLVVYYLTKNEGNPTWSGKARIQRFAFPRYNSDGSETRGYVNPIKSGFESWPKVDGDDGNGGVASLSGIATLVDFVDSRPMSEIDELAEAGGASVDCPKDYALTPSDATLTQFGFDGVRNFYACIRIPKALLASEVTESQEEGKSSFNQKVILFVRGNAAGKPGIKDVNEGFMPAISTQVLNRGVANKVPKSQ